MSSLVDRRRERNRARRMRNGKALDLHFNQGQIGHGSAVLIYSGGDNGTYFDSDGVLQTSGADEPRINANPPSGISPGILIEEARTNHFLNSGAPATQTSGALATGEHTLWMVGTGSVAVAANSATITGAGTATEGSPVTFDVTVGGTVDYTVTGSPTRAQSEKGLFATSYIPTVGSSVTRTADVATIAISDIAGFDETNYSYYVEADHAGDTSFSGIFSISDGATSDEVYVTGAAAGGDRAAMFTRKTAGNDGDVQLVDGGWPANIVAKLAGRVKTNDMAFSQDGETPGTDTTADAPTGMTILRFGNRADGANANTCHIARLALLLESLPDAQLQAPIP